MIARFRIMLNYTWRESRQSNRNVT